VCRSDPVSFYLVGRGQLSSPVHAQLSEHLGVEDSKEEDRKEVGD
jgi:hypothetical protein